MGDCVFVCLLCLAWACSGAAGGAWLRRVSRQLRQGCSTDWRGKRLLSYGLVVVLVTSLVVAAFYLNHPQPDVNNDTVSYVVVARHILGDGNPVNPQRTPGYPALIALVYLLAGEGNLSAVSIAQGILFILAALEMYVLTWLSLRRSWVALIVGLLVGTSTYLLGFVKPIIVEGFTLWLTVSLALGVVLFIRAMKPAYLWLSAGVLLALFMTRPEWVYLPIPLLLYLLLLARRRGLLRRMLPHSLAAVALLYLVLGLFICVNAAENGYVGISFVQNINVLGKVLQYHMQAEAPQEYTAIVQVADPFVRQGGWDPNQLALLYPALKDQYWELSGDYAGAIIMRHPLEFTVKTLPILFTSLQGYSSASPIQAHGPFAAPLAALEAISGDVYRSYQAFLLFVLLWGALLVWQRTRHLLLVEMMGAVVLLAFYELIVTSVGGYVQYWRLHIPFDPLMTLIIWGTALASVPFWKAALDRLTLPWRAAWWVWVAVLIGGTVGGLALLWLVRGAGGMLSLVGGLLAGHPLGVFLLLLLIAAFTRSAYRRRLSFQSDRVAKSVDAPALMVQPAAGLVAEEVAASYPLGVPQPGSEVGGTKEERSLEGRC